MEQIPLFLSLILSAHICEEVQATYKSAFVLRLWGLKSPFRPLQGSQPFPLYSSKIQHSVLPNTTSLVQLALPSDYHSLRQRSLATRQVCKPQPDSAEVGLVEGCPDDSLLHPHRHSPNNLSLHIYSACLFCLTPDAHSLSS